MEEDPYEEFAREHGEVPGRTRGIRSSSHAKDLGAERGFFRRRCRACGVSRASEVAQ